MTTGRAQLRAYVLVAEAKLINPTGAEVKAQVNIRNMGQTPAYKVVMSTVAQGFNIPGDITFAPAIPSADSSRFLLGPGQEGQRVISLQSIVGKPGAIEHLKSGRGILYIWGEILYRDAFGRHKHTRFRVEAGGKQGWPSNCLMFVSPDGNEAT